MTVADFDIIFDQNEVPYYTPGQLITGKVRLVLNTPKSISKIKIKFEGRAEVAWSETVQDGDSSTTIRHKSDEHYLKLKLILYERIDKAVDFKLPSGEHVYPFKFILPKNIPSSFFGVHGTIKYFATAKLHISGQFNKTKKESFRVKNSLDLNCFPVLRAPSETTKSKKFYMCCLPCGEVTLVARIPRSGFVGNETIPLILEIHNESLVSFKKITAHIIQRIEWRVQKKQKSSKKVLKSFTLSSTRSNVSEMIMDNIPIPDGESPYLENCHIITLKHELWIKADPGSGHYDLDIFLPITIGDLPFIQDDPIHRNNLFLQSLNKPDPQVSNFEDDGDENVKQDVCPIYTLSDVKRAEIFTNNEKY